MRREKIAKILKEMTKFQRARALLIICLEIKKLKQKGIMNNRIRKTSKSKKVNIKV